MLKGILLWITWLTALTTGIIGTSLVYQGTIGRQFGDLLYGIPILLFGIWTTGNILASAKQSYRRNKTNSTNA